MLDWRKLIAEANTGESPDAVSSEGCVHEEQTRGCEACFKKSISQIS